MRLEASDTLWLAGLADRVDGVTHAHLRLDWLQLLVHSDKHAGVDRQRQVEEEVVILPCDESLHVGCCDQHGQQTTEGDV